MLVKKQKYDENEIVTFKIANGDEIVAKIVAETDDVYTVSKPLVAMPAQNGLALVPALFSCDPDHNVDISKKHIMVDALTAEQVKAFYLTKTTGIQTIPKSKIIV